MARKTLEQHYAELRTLYFNDAEQIAWAHEPRTAEDYTRWLNLITDCTVSLMDVLEYGLPLDVAAERSEAMARGLRSIDFDLCLSDARSWWDSVIEREHKAEEVR